MKIKSKDREKALQNIMTSGGYTTHAAIEIWLAMPRKEQRRYIEGMKQRRQGSRR